MPSSSQQTIISAFTQASGSGGSKSDARSSQAGLLPAAEQGLTEALANVTQILNAQTQAISANTDALVQNSQAKSSGGAGGTAANVLNSAGEVLGGGLSLLPLASLLSSIFGSGDTTQPAPLIPYALPPSMNLEATTNGQAVSWGENGLTREAGAANTTSPQITIQVQAMDSQSFLDHSNDIAQAVRQAMLNMNSLNDVVTTL